MPNTNHSDGIGFYSVYGLYMFNKTQCGERGIFNVSGVRHAGHVDQSRDCCPPLADVYFLRLAHDDGSRSYFRNDMFMRSAVRVQDGITLDSS